MNQHRDLTVSTSNLRRERPAWPPKKPFPLIRALSCAAMVAAMLSPVALASAANSFGTAVAAPTIFSAGDTMQGSDKAGTVLTMHNEGNLSLSKAGTRLWSSPTLNNPGAYATFQQDCNLVIHAKDGALLWQSNSATREAGCRLELTEEGLLGIFTTANVSLWDNTKGEPALTTAPAPAEPVGTGVAVVLPAALFAGQTMAGSTKAATELTMHNDGNLVLSQAGTALWSSPTINNPGAYASFRSDCNLVIHAKNGLELWQSNSASKAPGCRIEFTDDGLLSIFDATNVSIWDSTKGGLAVTVPATAPLPARGFGALAMKLAALAATAERSVSFGQEPAQEAPIIASLSLSPSPSPSPSPTTGQIQSQPTAQAPTRSSGQARDQTPTQAPATVPAPAESPAVSPTPTPTPTESSKDKPAKPAASSAAPHLPIPVAIAIALAILIGIAAAGVMLVQRKRRNMG